MSRRLSPSLLRAAFLSGPLWLALSLPHAVAHPFGQQYYALRSEIRLVPDGPRVVVGGEVPIMVVLAEFRHFFRGVDRPGPAEDQAYLERKLDQLRDGLTLAVDGRAVGGSWVALDDPRNGKSAEGSFTYFVEFEPEQPWDLGGDELELVLTTGAYEGKPLWFSAYAGTSEDVSSSVSQEGSTGWAVNENSARVLLGSAADDPQGFAEPSGWSQDAAMRSLRVVIQPVESIGAASELPSSGCWGD
jgi:hypothetical protein